MSASVATARQPLIEAAVLAGLFRDAAGALRLVLVRRADGGLHGGQIAFPGGKREPADGSLAETALRETWEEIGLDPGAVEVLEGLPPVETLSSRFRIAPFLARIERPDRWRVDPREIDEVLEVSVDELLDPEAHGERTRHLPSWAAPRSVPFYRIGGDELWGATYRIVHPLLPRLAAGDWRL